MSRRLTRARGSVPVESDSGNSRANEVLVRSAPILADSCDGRPRLLEAYSPDRLPVFNPTVIRHEGQYVFLSKSCNLIVRDGARTVVEVGRYENHPVIHVLDDDLNVLERTALDDSLLAREQHDWCGLGDQRLFANEGSLWTLGSAVTGGRISQLLCRLDDAYRVTEAIALKSPIDASVEKNWVPVTVNGQVHLLYSLDPLVAYRVDLTTGDLHHVQTTSPPREHSSVDLRGGSRFVRLTNGLLLGIGHHAPVVLDQPYYLHRFLLLNETFEVLERSQPFFLQIRGIEFANGLELDGESLLVSYGIDDQVAAYFRVPLDRMHRFLGHLT